jgi:hypothetical protein
MICNRAMTAFMHCFLLKGVTIGEAELMVLSWSCLYCCYKEQFTMAGIFFYIILFLCIYSVIIAEVECN